MRRLLAVALVVLVVPALGCGYLLYGQRSPPSCHRSIARCHNGRLIGLCADRVVPEDKEPQIVVCPDNFCINTTDVAICERFHGGRGRLHVPKWQNLDEGWE
jgi:hypothetical protein